MRILTTRHAPKEITQGEADIALGAVSAVVLILMFFGVVQAF